MNGVHSNTSSGVRSLSRASELRVARPSANMNALILVDQSGSPSSTRTTFKTLFISLSTIASWTFSRPNFLIYASASLPWGLPSLGIFKYANLQRLAWGSNWSSAGGNFLKFREKSPSVLMMSLFPKSMKSTSIWPFPSVYITLARYHF